MQTAMNFEKSGLPIGQTCQIYTLGYTTASITVLLLTLLPPNLLFFNLLTIF